MKAALVMADLTIGILMVAAANTCGSGAVMEAGPVLALMTRGVYGIEEGGL